MFLVYVNDLNTHLEYSSGITFADDTNLYITGDNENTLISQAKNDLSILIDWFQANKLSLNLGKTNYIIFHNKLQNIDEEIAKLQFGNNEIKRVTSTVFLGLTIDEHLNWENHVKSLAGKISKNLYLINSIKHFVPRWSLRNLYYGYIQSTIEYGLMLWGPMVKKPILKRIDIQQRKVLRILGNAKNCSSALFKNWKILKLEDLIELNLAKLAYQFQNNDLPLPVSSLFTANSFHHDYITRSRNYPMIQKHKSSLFNKSFLCKCPAALHGLSNDSANARNIKSFCNKFTTSKLATY